MDVKLTPADIRTHWPEVADGLREICQQGGGLIPEDYYATVALGKASLFVCEQNEGFVILQLTQMQDGPGNTPYKVLRVMAAWCKGGDARKRYLPALEEIANNEGCAYMEMETTRRGFLKDPGWFLDKMIFRREVANHG
jgi:hypothetical protein